MLGFTVYHLCLRLESTGQVVKVDSGLCQPAGTPISTRIGYRLGVTSIVDLEADVLRPIHVSVERRVTVLTHVQATFDTLTVVFFPAHATRLARVALGHFHDLDTLDLGFVFDTLLDVQN